MIFTAGEKREDWRIYIFSLCASFFNWFVEGETRKRSGFTDWQKECTLGLLRLKEMFIILISNSEKSQDALFCWWWCCSWCAVICVWVFFHAFLFNNYLSYFLKEKKIYVFRPTNRHSSHSFFFFFRYVFLWWCVHGAAKHVMIASVLVLTCEFSG